MKHHGAIKVGLTGGIGSGKSTVCRLFDMLGVPVYDSDLRAGELMAEDGELIGGIKRAFGDGSYHGNRLDRARLAEIVFNDREALARLNSLVHPAVIRDFGKRVSGLAAGTPYIVMESAIILDAGLEKEVDYVVTVSAPAELRIERSMARDGTAREKIEARMANQMTDPERERRADFVVVNDGRTLVWEQVLRLDAFFRKEHAERQGRQIS